MDNTVKDIAVSLRENNTEYLLKLLVELMLTRGRTIPEELRNELKTSSEEERFMYYHDMIYYAVKWYDTGYSVSKLKVLMNEAIEEFSGSGGFKGKQEAMRMFMDYLKHKKQIDKYISRMRSSM